MTNERSQGEMSQTSDSEDLNAASAITDLVEVVGATGDAHLFLTVVGCPDLNRIGERSTWLLQPEKTYRLSRLEPRFSHPGSEAARPLGNRRLSRSPISFGWSGEVLRIDPSGWRNSIMLGAQPLEGVAEISKEELMDGIVLLLARTVVLFVQLRTEYEYRDLPAAASHGLIGASSEMVRVYQAIDRVAALDVPVLLSGETGTGKELVAQAIARHPRNPRRERAFQVINLAALPPSLAVVEMFGAEAGAYTGQKGRRQGAFQRAEGGTLFLDEVGDAPPDLQSFLLRALEMQEIQPLGSQHATKIDVRILAATDVDLARAGLEGNFRAPLYHRLAGFEIQLPALRERREDICRLAVHFFKEIVEEIGAPDPPSNENPVSSWLPTELMFLLVQQDWPGNVRHLQQVMRRWAFLLAEASWEPFDLMTKGFEGLARDLRLHSMHAVETSRSLSPEKIREVLERHGWNVNRSAREIGIGRSHLYSLIREHGLESQNLEPIEIAGLIETHRMIGDYQLIKVLGSGGMGTVFLANDRRLGRPVALKVMRPRNDGADSVERFLQEAAVLAQISHPYLVQVFDVFAWKGLYCLVMEHIDGNTIEKVARQSEMPINRAIRYFEEITDALVTIHGHGVIHRDLKSANVMITHQGHVKVLDFGLVKLILNNRGPKEMPGRIAGTYHAMSPEQTEGRALDERSDLFSLGALGYEILSGIRPFLGESKSDSMERVRSYSPPPVHHIRPEIPEPVSGLIEDLLAKRAEERPDSARIVLQRLRQHIGGEFARLVDKDSRQTDSISRIRLGSSGTHDTDSRLATISSVSGALALALAPEPEPVMWGQAEAMPQSSFRFRPEAAYRRFADLVDRSMVGPLSPEEEKEFERIEAFFDEDESRRLEPLRQALVDLRDEMRVSHEEKPP